MMALERHLDKIKHLIPSAAELELEVIEGGYSNHSYLLSWHGSKQCVLRIPDVDETLFGISRSAEKQALEKAVTQLLSPPCYYFEVESGIMVSQYVPQKPFSWDVSHDELTVIRLAKSLRTIHQENGHQQSSYQSSCHRASNNGKEYLLGDVILSYLDHADHCLVHKSLDKTALKKEASCHGKEKGADFKTTLTDEVKWLRETVQPYLNNIPAYDAVMCHNDLNPKNCLADEMHFWVIDWEYAGYGDRLFDIAVVFSSHNFTESQQALFFQHYWGSSELESDLLFTLDNYQMLYKLREMAWMLLKYSTSDYVDDFSAYFSFKENVINTIQQPIAPINEESQVFERTLERIIE